MLAASLTQHCLHSLTDIGTGTCTLSSALGNAGLRFKPPCYLQPSAVNEQRVVDPQLCVPMTSIKASLTVSSSMYTLHRHKPTFCEGTGEWGRKECDFFFPTPISKPKKLALCSRAADLQHHFVPILVWTRFLTSNSQQSSKCHPAASASGKMPSSSSYFHQAVAPAEPENPGC